MLRSRPSQAAGATALLLLLALPAHAQERTFVDRIDVNLVEVEVVVTDEEGERVPGLRREDFHLEVDGREVAVEFFDEVRRLPVTETVEGKEITTETELAPVAGSRQGRSFLLYFDDAFSDPRGRNALLKRLERELAELGPGDRVAVVRYAGRGLEVLTDWTSSVETLQEVLAAERKFIPENLRRSVRVSALSEGYLQEKLLGEQIGRSVTAMVVAMRTFSGAPGRKILLPVTSGWPYQRESVADDRPTPVGEEIRAEQRGGADAIDSAVGESSEVSALSDIRPYRSFALLEPMFDAANRLGYTIYPYLVGQPCGAIGESSAMCVDDPILQRSALVALAKETGGRMAGVGATTRAPLARVLGDTDHYYKLAFRYTDAVPGVRAAIEVTVDRPGVEVRHRRSVLELTRHARATLETEEALLLGEGAGNLTVDLGKPKLKRRVVRLPLEVQIPLDWVTLLPKGKKRQLALELRVAALDERGERSEVPVVPIQIEVPPPPPGVHIVYETVVELRKTSQRLVISLHDTLSGEALSTALEFAP